MNLETLRVFMVVSKAKSIARASEILDMTGSSISRKIKGLEEELNIELFHRGGKAFSPTSQGMQILAQVESILGEIDQIKNLANEEQQVTGSVRLIVPPSIGSALTDRFLVPFIKKYPEVNLRVRVNSGRRIDTLYDNDIALSPNLPNDSSLIAKKLFQGKQYFYAGVGLLERYGVPKSPEQLSSFPYLVLLDDDSYCQGTQHWNNGSQQGQFVTNPVAYSDHSEVLAKMLCSDIGAACLPKGAFINQDKAKYVRLFSDEVYHLNTLYIIYPSRKYRPHRINVLVQELQAFFDSMHEL